MSKWEMVKFTDVFIDATSKAKKIPKEHYLENGSYQIIDQGKNEIAGYANDATGLFTDVPAIIFGDHTRCLKYVKYPLFIGADGVKLLLSKHESTDYRYLFFALTSVKIENTGYNRHFKWLKEASIPLPPIEEQRKIADTLDKASDIIKLYKEQLAELDSLIQSVFYDMFGESKTNSKQWETKKLGNISLVGSSKRVFSSELIDKGIPFYRGTEIGALATGKIIHPELFIAEKHYQDLCESSGKPSVGDLLMPSICNDGRIWRVDSESQFYFKDGRVLWVRFKEKLNSDVYMQYALREKIITDYNNIASGTTFAELKIFALKNVDIMLPPLPLQQKFATIVIKKEQQKTEMQKALDDAQMLFDSLMQEYFEGE